MNYRHIYHAGNFADVVKHIILVSIIESLMMKEKPFCYIDTHAGSGRYNLLSTEAQKTHEFSSGIIRLINEDGPKPTLIEEYLQAVKNINPNDKLQFYPGSPRIAYHFLREQDRMVLCELHPEVFKLLKQEFNTDKQVAVHFLDGYQALKAFLPPKPNRGIVLIDPPYEVPNEFELIIKALVMATKRWPQGIYMVWYPIKNRQQITRFHQSLKQTEIAKILMAELNLFPDDSPLALNGSGMIIINPPWQFDKKLNQIFPYLLQCLDQSHQGDYAISWLSQERGKN